MSDLSITAANVLAGSNADTESGIAGETLTAGVVVYFDETTSRWLKADADAAAAVQREAVGIALNGASSGQPVVVQKSGDITLGSVLTGGVAYYLSGTAGGIAPLADVGTGEYYVLLGLAKSATVLALDISYSGVSA